MAEEPITGVTPTASLPHWNDRVVANMVDGDMATHYMANSGSAVGDWVQLDLGVTYELTRVMIQQGAYGTTADPNYFYDGILEYSLDESSWTTLATGLAQAIDVVAGGVQARYVRLRAGAASTNWPTVGEFQAYGTLPAATTATLRYVDAPGSLADAAVLGWWNKVGGTIDPVTVLGWWDGAAIQPLAGASGGGGGTPTLLDATATTNMPTYSGTLADITDHDPATTWGPGSGWEAISYVQIDLGAVYDLTQIEIVTNFAAPYQVRISEDKVWWDVVQSGLTGNQTLSVTQSGRYLRMYCDATTSGWYTVSTLDAIGTLSTTASTAITPTTASTNMGTWEGSMSSITDLNSDTVWVPNSGWTADSSYVQLDLGALYTVNELIILTNFSSGRTFQIRHSADGVNWTTLSTGHAGKVKLSIDPTVQARYFRVYSDASISDWFAIYEILAHGVPA